MFGIDTLLALIPVHLRQQIGWKLLRSASPSYRAYSDLFVFPYCEWADWRSGLGDGAHLLYGITRAIRPQTIVEIGSARGRSTCALALACKENGVGHVHAIDPHLPNAWSDHRCEDSLAVLRKRLSSLEFCEFCTLHVGTSVETATTWNCEIDFLFIDGDHTYEGARRDFELFAPFLHPMALVAFHDSAWEHYKNNPWYREDIGVPAYLQELADSGYHMTTFSVFPGLTIMHKSKDGFPFFPTLTTLTTTKVTSSK